MLSDLNFSSMSETNLNWSSLIPSKRPSTASHGVNEVLSQDGDDHHHNVKRAISLQDAFRDSKKKFIARSKQRQREAAAAGKQPENAVGQQNSASSKNAKTKHDKSKSVHTMKSKAKVASLTKDSSTNNASTVKPTTSNTASSGKIGNSNNSSTRLDSNADKLDKGKKKAMKKT